MSAHTATEAVLLAGVVVTCWLGVLGMVRMREPMQALHYLSLPASMGSVLLVIALFLATGNSQASWKTAFIAVILICTNSVVTHTTARAFRVRELGHWKPQPEDRIEQVKPENSRS
jgi:monovalent cation/proton antiporter MnhG/PhaG subunit